MPKILVVDDEPALREMLDDILTANGYEVITAADGAEGLKKVRDESPDLVILDGSMPVLDGYETLEHMRRDPMLVNKPVIMLSVMSSDHDQIRGLKLGVDDYLTKPFKTPLLLARVRAVLERNAFSTSANPLTLLSGNAVIKAEAEKRIASGVPFAMVYIDLNNFKSFNDKYGFQRGDDVIKNTASVIVQATKEFGIPGDFIGHIGGDDFIVITTPETMRPVCEGIISYFDEGIADFYDTEDRERGYIVSVDRSNNVKQFPLMTISLSVISTAQTRIAHYGRLAEIAAELKKVAKSQNCSAYVVNRRRE